MRMNETGATGDGRESEAGGGLEPRPGKVVLMGSGETSPSGRRIHHHLFAALGVPVLVAVLETPAGFELNSTAVAGRVGEFIQARLPNFCPEVSVLPARRRDGDLSTNNPEVLAPLLRANYIFLGPGSPTYLVRHLQNSLAWRYLLGRHQQGATICLASAAAIAFGTVALPVYEIFKAGLDPFWAQGLDFFDLFGLRLAIISHWDNQEGGANLDTSHCFIGRHRLEGLRRRLDPDVVTLGVDEHTGLVFDFQAQRCEVMGRGGVTLLRPGSVEAFESGAVFPFGKLGNYHPPAEVPAVGLPVGEEPASQEEPVPVPAEVLQLIGQREEARRTRQWALADELRQQVAALGYELQDTPEGTQYRYVGAPARG